MTEEHQKVKIYNYILIRVSLRSPVIDHVSFLTFAAMKYLVQLVESGSERQILLDNTYVAMNLTAGDILFEGKDVTHLKGRRLSEFRKQMIFQDPKPV